MNLDAYIESILFFRGAPVSLSFLAKVLGKKEEEVLEALDVLEKRLEGGGLVLTRYEKKVSLGTAPKASGFIEALIKDDLSKDLGKAGLETLSIVVYRGPVSRGEVDYIRGVNSSFILRNLLVRGLIEKVNNPNDMRIAMYKPTMKLLSYLGVKDIKDMPRYLEIRKEIEGFEEKSKAEEKKNGE